MIFYKKNSENSKKKTPRLALSSRMTAWAIISTQALTPLLFVPNALAKAFHAHSFEPTLNQKDRAVVVRPGEDYFNLPSLGAETNNADATAQLAENYLSNTAIQAGQILSEADVKNASASWARSVGEQAVNQEINNWLNKKGTARVSVGLDRKISGDILLPVMQGADNLFATQFGLRGNEDRNTANLGLIYRYYIGDWMYGINTFYDYDYTGKNRRLGVGGEAWTNYLKLSVNSYYGLTNWHQSPLSSMKDYDERPANGFDIRTEAYLPAYPQLGANLKYEQYIGKGIDLGSGTQPDDLRDNPRALTLGMSYTPVPLVTLKGEHSVGDKKESRMGIDVSYRFGVPWAEQINGGAVGALRSVRGSLGEFVDRNYDIVMQYRKQVLLRIELPKQVTAQEAQTITLPLTVLKAKYGLKDVAWTVPPDFLSAGGSYSQPALTQLEMKMPASIGTAREYVVEAVATDNNGNRSNIASAVVRVEPSEGVIKDLLIAPAGPVVANGTDPFTVTAQVLNDAGQPIVGQPVTFSIEKSGSKPDSAGAALLDGDASENQILESTTDEAGNATVLVRSHTPGERTVTVTLKNGRTVTGKLRFIAGSAAVTLDDATTEKVANGTDSFTYTVVIKDAHGNPVPGATVNWSQDKGSAVTLQPAQSITDAGGKAVSELQSSKTEALQVQVSAALVAGPAVNADKTVNFRQQTVNFHGQIKNAIDGTGLPGASIELFGSQGDTTPLYALTSSSAGAYSFEKIPAEKYYLKVATTGFITEEGAIDLSAGVDLEKHYALSPDLNGQSARIVLTWGAEPGDLDGYLLVPSEDDPDTLIKVGYGKAQPPGADARLDTDGRDGFGPETITIDKFHTGVYCYFVRKGSSSPKNLPESDARVSLILADGTSKTLNLPDTGGDYKNAIWRVFKIDTTHGGLEVNVTNDLAPSKGEKCW